MAVRGHDHNGKFRVRKGGAAVVEQVVNRKFDARTDDPSQGTEVVVYDVGKEEWVVRAKL